MIALMSNQELGLQENATEKERQEALAKLLQKDKEHILHQRK